ncbi:MAG: hypothetical protein CM1200mP3_01270 [Chloroflexota bacterium]|nr:MAG: hypothetical protein CM1200mP3_01270 [Chloroflexota bacterium]
MGKTLCLVAAREYLIGMQNIGRFVLKPGFVGHLDELIEDL